MLGQMPAGSKEYFVPKSPVVVDEAGVSSKTAIDKLNSENMELKSKVGDLHYFNTLKYSRRWQNWSPTRLHPGKYFLN